MDGEFTMTTLGNVAHGFMIVGIIQLLVCPLSLFWTIPMTVHYRHSEGIVTVGTKVCILLFVNTIAGILALCDSTRVA